MDYKRINLPPHVIFPIISGEKLVGENTNLRQSLGKGNS